MVPIQGPHAASNRCLPCCRAPCQKHSALEKNQPPVHHQDQLDAPHKEHQPHAREPLWVQVLLQSRGHILSGRKTQQKANATQKTPGAGKISFSSQFVYRSPREEATHIQNPPTYEEAMQSLGRAPTQQDLGPFSPVSLSSSLVPYEDDSPSTPEEEEQQPAGEERMEDEGGDIVAEKTVMKEHQEAKAEYIPQSPQYTPASEDEEDMSSDEDIEAPYLAPKSANTTPPNEDLRTGYYAVSKEDQPT